MNSYLHVEERYNIFLLALMPYIYIRKRRRRIEGAIIQLTSKEEEETSHSVLVLSYINTKRERDIHLLYTSKKICRPFLTRRFPFLVST